MGRGRWCRRAFALGLGAQATTVEYPVGAEFSAGVGELQRFLHGVGGLCHTKPQKVGQREDCGSVLCSQIGGDWL